MLPLIYCVFALIAYLYAAVYFIHMFQLNGYHRDAHIKWQGDVLGTLCAKMTFAFLALILSLFDNEITFGIACVMFVLTVIAFLPKKAKKPLVYTARVKRLLATCIVIFVLVCVLSFALPYCIVLTPLVVLLANLAVLISDIINSPIENAIKRYYINDAKKILASRRNLKVIGITGSYGKTSCKNFLTKLLSVKYNVLMTPASFNTPMGVVRTVRENLKNSHEIFICEMGAKYVGDIKELCEIAHPEMGIITSVGPQHLESFGSIDNVVSTKFELFDAVRGKGKMYLNFDSELIRNKAENFDCIVSYGCESENVSCIAKNITLSDKGTDFDIVYKGQEIHFSTKLLGRHNVQNLAGCIAIALDLGVEKDGLVLAVKRLESVEHRLQLLDGGNMAIIDDAFNANPGGTKAALEVLNSFDGTKIIVTPGMIELGDRQSELNMEFGRNCASVCDYILLVGGRIADDVYKGVLETDFDREKLIRFGRVEDAVDFARRIETQGKKYVLLENDLPDNY